MSTNHLAPRYAISSIPPVTSSLLSPNILLNTIFSNTLSFLSSRNVSDQVSHPYKTTGKIIVLYILILNFWIVTWKTEDSAPNASKHSLTSIHALPTVVQNKRPVQSAVYLPIENQSEPRQWQHCTFCVQITITFGNNIFISKLLFEFQLQVILSWLHAVYLNRSFYCIA